MAVVAFQDRRCDAATAQALEDNDPGIRAVAALALANCGEVPPLSFFEDIVQRNYGFGNLPFGADSIGVEADAVRSQRRFDSPIDVAV